MYQTLLGGRSSRGKKVFGESSKGSSQAESLLSPVLSSFLSDDGPVGDSRQPSDKFICSGRTAEPALPACPAQELLS